MNITDRLSNFILLEKRRPQGTENLYGLLHAIKNHFQITFSYQKFWEDEITKRITEPYALKEFKNRWYIIVKDLKDGNVKTFALDRLSELEISKKHFQIPNDLNVNDYFKYCFGIITPDENKPKEIILSFEPIQGKYIKSLPLHTSQEVLKDNDEELIIKLNIFITHDFFMELLSYGANMKVIKPASLINDIKKAYQNALKLY